MICFFWFSSLLLALLRSTECIQWVNLTIEELSNRDDEKRIVLKRGTINDEFAITVTCPKPFVIHPRFYENSKQEPHVFVEAGRNLVEVPLSKVVHGLHGGPIVSILQDAETNSISISYPYIHYNNASVIQIMRRHATRIYFLCASEHSSIYDDLANKLSYLKLDTSPFVDAVKSDVRTYLKRRKTAIGVLHFDISRIRKVTHGCGSMPTPQFVNESEYDGSTGIRSCTVDIMEHPHVGFYCQGRVEPRHCFVQMYDSETSEVVPAVGLLDLKQSYAKWHFAIFDRKVITRRFNKYCKCIDDSTGNVTAQITLVTGMSHVCDISRMFSTNKSDPIMGIWCDIGMIPGSVVSIILPMDIYDESRFTLQDGQGIRRKPVRATSYVHPHDMDAHFLQQEDVINCVHPLRQYSFRNTFSSHALDIDLSHQKEGIITVHYLENKPLTYPDWFGGVAYMWNVTFNKNSYLIKDVTAIINVIPAMTHDYNVFGCEPPTLSIFNEGDGSSSIKKNLIISHHDFRICKTHVYPGCSISLYCPPGQHMVPEYCIEYGFDESLQGLSEWKGIAETMDNELVPGMRIIHKFMQGSRMTYTRSCSCVDDNGIERARITATKLRRHFVTYSKLGNAGNMIIPSLQISKINAFSKQLPEIENIPFSVPAPKTTNMLYAGMSMIIGCDLDVSQPVLQFIDLQSRTQPFTAAWNQLLNEQSLNLTPQSEWDTDLLSGDVTSLFPLNSLKYFYKYFDTDGKMTMMPTAYSTDIGTNTAGFKVTTDVDSDDDKSSRKLYLENPKGAIIVSKNNTKFINLRYVCGKLTKRHRLKVTTVGNNVDVYMQSQTDDEDMDVDVETIDDEDVTPDSTGHMAQNATSVNHSVIKETRSLNVWGVVNVTIPVTDPYLSGCGISDQREGLFRMNTAKLMNDKGVDIGCIVDTTKENASFYCPLPYVTEPKDCMPPSEYSYLTVVKPGGSGNAHFYVFMNENRLPEGQKKIRKLKSKSFDCHCNTTTGYRMSTIRLFSFYCDISDGI
ncbi:hypothetical protein BgAZ_101050 [Babesia gibsoni]|uniref:6-Cys domain-containing protein n=1 Tax=Babesia gibsoni TaxID=33632 RepID=A0AAD8PF74_BABGI|nr:hypothetical protein BgAZ_101050 [Babesia gibsoni]